MRYHIFSGEQYPCSKGRPTDASSPDLHKIELIFCNFIPMEYEKEDWSNERPQVKQSSNRFTTMYESDIKKYIYISD